MTIWQMCEGQKQFQHPEGTLLRIAESQVQVATRIQIHNSKRNSWKN